MVRNLYKEKKMKSLIFHCTAEDIPFLPILKPLLQGRCQTYVDTTIPVAATELVLKSAKKGGAPIFSTSQKLLNLVEPNASNPRISDYAGSTVVFRDTKFIFLDPVDSLVKVPYGRFVYERFLSKVLAPENWIVEPPFKWELYQLSKHSELLEFFRNCCLIAIDIETPRNDPDRTIACISYTGIQIGDGKITVRTVVVPCDDYSNISFIRQVNSCEVPKVLQNGKYDLAYLFRYSCPVTAYTFDTINLFHCWLSELPKDLGFISAFMLRNYKFHKNDGKSGDKMDYYQYNAMDTYTTLFSCLALLLEIPEYAKQNFLQEFPLVFPSHLMEMTGVKWDSQHAEQLKEKVNVRMDRELRKLQTMVACPTFNPSSPPQTVRLFALLGSKDITGSTPPEKDKVANRHPLNKRIIDAIVEYREARKLETSYFKEGIEWNGRCFYAVNPHGTDTGRLASRESQYWCGLQIQNIPRDDESDGGTTVKEVFIADNDFLFGEADYSQAEARDTAYISGDVKLIEAVDDETKDFHSKNTSAFFGLSYDKICSSVFNKEHMEWEHKRLDKPLIDIAKRVNHGANYNMGAQVMLDTMGIGKVLKAKELLSLPKNWSVLQVTEYLLQQYDKTYPVVRNKETGYYARIISDVLNSGILVGATGWTRRCFGNPKTNKRHLNSYAAHPSQSLNAMTLNKAIMKVFNEVWMQHHKNFKLHAQIHDSCFFSYRQGHEYLAEKVKECMIIPTPVTDIFGVRRTLVVPVDLKVGGKRWSEVKKPERKKVAA